MPPPPARLERSGAIAGYHARLDAAALGLTFESLVFVTRDLAAYRELYDARLAALPGVQRLSSTLVMASVVEGRPLPL